MSTKANLPDVLKDVTPQARYQRKMAESGCCTICGASDAPGSRCKACAHKVNTALRAKRHQLRMAGLCFSCGQPSGTFTKCRDCRIDHSDRARWSRGVKVACRMCGQLLTGPKMACPKQCRSQWRMARTIEAKLGRMDAKRKAGRWVG